MVKWLLDEEADPKMLADNGYAPIHKACEAGCIDIIQHFQQVYKHLSYYIIFVGNCLIMKIVRNAK